MNNKNIFVLLGIIILVVAIPVVLYLVRQQQIFKPRAEIVGSGVEFTGPNVTPAPQGGKASTTNTDVQLKIAYDPANPPPTPTPVPGTTSTISGKVFWDRNNNGSFNQGEVGYFGVGLMYLHTLSGEFKDSLATDQSGNFTFLNVLAGSYKVTLAAPLQNLNPPTTRIQNASVPPNASNINFALACENPQHPACQQ